MKFCLSCKQYKDNKDFHKHSYHKDGLASHCKKCRTLQEHQRYIENSKSIKLKAKSYRKKYPEKLILWHINRRCNDVTCKDYKNYGGRGIECRITEQELKELWFMDKAYLMDKPSIDRIDNDGHYTFDNCRFIEFNENSCRNKRKPVLQYDLEGNFIREFKSISEASRDLSVSRANIISALKGVYKQANGFKWKYKE